MCACVCAQASQLCCYSGAPQRLTSNCTALQHVPQQVFQLNRAAIAATGHIHALSAGAASTNCAALAEACSQSPAFTLSSQRYREETAVQHALAALRRLRLMRQRAVLLGSRALARLRMRLAPRDTKIVHDCTLAASSATSSTHTERQQRCGGGGLGGGGPPWGPCGFCGGGRCCSPAGRWM